MISLIAALSENRVIGNKGMIPWQRMPADMKHLKELSVGHILLMGSETARSMLRYKSPLMKDCPVIVLTRNDGAEFLDAGLQIAHSLEEAFEKDHTMHKGDLMILGGGQIYAQALALQKVDRLYLTLIHTIVEGDVMFPEFSKDEWQEIAREEHPSDDHNPYAYDFLTYERRQKEVQRA